MPKSDLQGDLPECLGRLARHDSVEGCAGGLDLRARHLHVIKCLDVENV